MSDEACRWQAIKHQDGVWHDNTRRNRQQAKPSEPVHTGGMDEPTDRARGPEARSASNSGLKDDRRLQNETVSLAAQQASHTQALGTGAYLGHYRIEPSIGKPISTVSNRCIQPKALQPQIWVTRDRRSQTEASNPPSGFVKNGGVPIGKGRKTSPIKLPVPIRPADSAAISSSCETAEPGRGTSTSSGRRRRPPHA